MQRSTQLDLSFVISSLLLNSAATAFVSEHDVCNFVKLDNKVSCSCAALGCGQRSFFCEADLACPSFTYQYPPAIYRGCDGYLVEGDNFSPALPQLHVGFGDGVVSSLQLVFVCDGLLVFSTQTCYPFLWVMTLAPLLSIKLAAPKNSFPYKTQI
eukprot:6462785-Amphidinium_carterae.2